ncbi:hypothetical protein GO755_34575 [Spirosoma sp. HMF4905]|uniref:ZU5 domain-containing protein n=1 Tax=Spirosoma arboris TaxID=2682092 RepID=A0A7K1SN40_9BACT|nr:hypothetical protein [Spirosoma arboris]MVM35201.1 hypothetical protein [Spirosoma arboris]
MKLTKFLSFLILSGFFACQKPTDAVNPTDPAPSVPKDTTTIQGVVYDKGTPVGEPVRKAIGPEGGTLASADGTLTLTIPAGAVAKTTTFTVQPVTPTLPGLIGGLSFRLLPEGQTFAQPVKLQYHYDTTSLDGTSSQLLFMAYQGSDGYWKALTNTELDESAQTLTVTTKHFSDWGAFAEYYMTVNPYEVMPGQSAKFTISMYDIKLNKDSGVENAEEVFLAQQHALQDPGNIRNWQLFGPGGFNVDASRVSGTYLAAANVVQGYATVTVEIYNFLPPSQQPRKGAAGKAIIKRAIHIGGTYFRAIFDGQTYDCDNFGLIDTGEGYLIQGNLTNTKGLSLNLHVQSIQVGSYPFYQGGADNEEHINGKAIVATVDLLNPQPSSYHSYYYDCNNDVASPGHVTITKVEQVNGQTIVTGSYTATLYQVKGFCPDQTVSKKEVQAEFRAVEF